MNKDLLLKSLVKEMNICRRLYTRVPPDQFDFRPKEGMRSTLELLQYLSWCGSGMILFWSQKEETDFRVFFAPLIAKSKEMAAADFMEIMDKQIETGSSLISRITDEDLNKREVILPSGEKTFLGHGIIDTSVKWTTAYKLQLYLYLKLSTDQKLGTPDAWRLTDI